MSGPRSLRRLLALLTIGALAVVVPAAADEYTTFCRGFAKLGGAIFSGPILLPCGSVAAPSSAFSAFPNTGTANLGCVVDDYDIITNGGARYHFDSARIRIAAGARYTFSSSTDPHASAEDLVLARSGPGLLGLTDTDSNPAMRLNVNGAPSLTTCGDGALAAGSSNTVGRVVGTTQTACTLTFSLTFGGNSADCWIANLIANRGFVSAASSTAFTVSGLTAGDDFMYFCVGR